MQLLIATGNAGKLRELRAMLAGVPDLEVLGLADLDPLPPVEEDGETFEENACKKAVQVALATGLSTLADDSGLEVDALGGAPGVRSARYAGADATDADNNQKLLAELQAVPEDRRTARYRAVLVLALVPDAPAETLDADALELHTVTGSVDGTILRTPRGDAGFGYDPLFLPRGQTLTMAELPAAEKNQISHRGKALRDLMTWLGHTVMLRSVPPER